MRTNGYVTIRDQIIAKDTSSFIHSFNTPSSSTWSVWNAVLGPEVTTAATDLTSQGSRSSWGDRSILRVTTQSSQGWDMGAQGEKPLIHPRGLGGFPWGGVTLFQRTH